MESLNIKVNIEVNIEDQELIDPEEFFSNFNGSLNKLYDEIKRGIICFISPTNTGLAILNLVSLLCTYEKTSQVFEIFELVISEFMKSHYLRNIGLDQLFVGTYTEDWFDNFGFGYLLIKRGACATFLKILSNYGLHFENEEEILYRVGRNIGIIYLRIDTMFVGVVKKWNLERIQHLVEYMKITINRDDILAAIEIQNMSIFHYLLSEYIKSKGMYSEITKTTMSYLLNWLLGEYNAIKDHDTIVPIAIDLINYGADLYYKSDSSDSYTIDNVRSVCVRDKLIKAAEIYQLKKDRYNFIAVVSVINTCLNTCLNQSSKTQLFWGLFLQKRPDQVQKICQYLI